jgi:hypothetical protein
VMGHLAPPSAQGRSEAIPHPKPNKVSPCENYAAPASTLPITFRSIDTWSLPHEHGIVHNTNNPCKMALCGGSDLFWRSSLMSALPVRAMSALDHFRPFEDLAGCRLSAERRP